MYIFGLMKKAYGFEEHTVEKGFTTGRIEGLAVVGAETTQRGLETYRTHKKSVHERSEDRSTSCLVDSNDTWLSRVQDRRREIN
jgi:hypothetical protein